jgi:hypothetical protein
MPARLGLAFEIAGRLVSIAVLGFALLRGGGNPLLFLWGLWIEEALSFIGLSIRQAILHRPRLGCVYYLFLAAHLVFVAIYSLSGVSGLFAEASAPRLAAPSLGSVLSVAGALAFWTAVDILRAVLRRRAAGKDATEDAGEEGRIHREAWLALFLPHVTIIAGGFCLIMFRLGNWMAWGILAGKVLFEAISFAIPRGTDRGTRADSGDESRPGEQQPPSASGRGS